MNRFANELSPSSRAIFKSPPKQEFFAVKRNVKRLKTSNIFKQQTQYLQNNLKKQSQEIYPSQQLANQGKFKQKELISTFGSDNFLSFRSKPPKRKRKKNNQTKTSMCSNIGEESQSDNQSSMLFSKETSVSQKVNVQRVITKPTQYLWSRQDFVFLEKIGEGSYSQVFRVLQKKTGFICSLKILNKQKIRTLNVQQNLFRQIKIHSFLDHPNIVSLYGYFSDKQSIYLICELATNYSIYDSISTAKANGNRQMPKEIVSNYVGQLCSALKYLHNNWILHRDIKPQNLLITFSTTVKLCDFGWSIYNPDKSLRQTLCGTPLYLAPQLVKQSAYNQSVDVWATGIVTYQLLTGQIPFRIRSIRDLTKVLTEDIRYDHIKEKEAVEFISSALKKQTQDRKTIDEIYHHPFLSQYHQSKSL